MKRALPLAFAVTTLAGVFSIMGCRQNDNTEKNNIPMSKIEGSALTYQLPAPQTRGTVTVEEALSSRRSRRSYSGEAITAEQLSQILWAAYGVSSPSDNPRFMGGFRTAPSSGATYPLNLYVLVGDVKDIEPGFYRFIAAGHKIERITDKDLRPDLCAAALNQEMVRKAPALLFYSATFSRTTERYGTRGSERYVCMDLGHSAENVYLQAEALHLGTCAVGAFTDSEVKKVLMLPEEEVPLYIMPIGKYLGR